MADIKKRDWDEPAHFRQIEELLEREDASRLINELTAVLKKYGL
jgi:hypothetical protein